MINNAKLFLGATFFCGISTFIGSVLGHAFSQTALFTGAIIGGWLGTILSAFLFVRFRVIDRNSFIPVISWGIVSFGVAILFAVTNLNSPIVPLISISFVGIGFVIGNTLKLTNEQNKRFYFLIIGFLLIIPTLYFVFGSLIKYSLGYSQSFTLLDRLESSASIAKIYNTLSPFVFLGGTALSILLNISFSLKNGFKNLLLLRNGQDLSIANLAVALMSICLLLMLSSYLLLENL